MKKYAEKLTFRHSEQITNNFSSDEIKLETCAIKNKLSDNEHISNDKTASEKLLNFIKTHKGNSEDVVLLFEALMKGKFWSTKSVSSNYRNPLPWQNPNRQNADLNVNNISNIVTAAYVNVIDGAAAPILSWTNNRNSASVSSGRNSPRTVEQSSNILTLANDLQSDTVVLLDRQNKKFLKEKYRLETFRKWPKEDVVKASLLAADGFCYCGEGDRVECFFCEGVLRTWEPNDCPNEEHDRHFPQCPFVMGYDVGNIPIRFDYRRKPELGKPSSIKNTKVLCNYIYILLMQLMLWYV